MHMVWAGTKPKFPLTAVSYVSVVHLHTISSPSHFCHLFSFLTGKWDISASLLLSLSEVFHCLSLCVFWKKLVTPFITKTRPVKQNKNLTPPYSAASVASAWEPGQVSSQQQCTYKLVSLSLRGQEVPCWLQRQIQRTGKIASSWACFEKKGQSEAGLRPQNGKKSPQFWKANSK